MKNCPFCKKEIEANAEQCKFCKMVLIEKIPTKKTFSGNSYTPPKEEATKQKTYTYTPPKKSSTSKIRFGIPNSSQGWIISIALSILLSLVLNHNYSAPNPLPSPAVDTTASENSNPLPPPVLTTNTVATPNPFTAILQDKAPTPNPISKAEYYSLPNGTVLFSDPSLNGPGILKILNGSGSDAIVKLIPSSGSNVKSVFTVYVRAGNNYSIKKINDGTYRLAFKFGSNWDSNQNKFLVNPSAEAFNDTFDFSTYTTDDGDYTDTHYSTYEITLNPVAGGTATTNPIDPSVFDKY